MGSSPRMRGTRPSLVHGAEPARIIPADAGNTCSRRFRWHHQWDHPRGCGEHDFMIPTVLIAQGSSPRMRGTRKHPCIRQAMLRIIPADAGNTGLILSSVLAIRDHPRGCGEHIANKPFRLRYLGSSPRMRGTPQDRSCMAVAVRDHPRGCGEHRPLKLNSVPFTGSSPRMRGTRTEPILSARQHGIIPADAGNTVSVSHLRRAEKDHPRRCGEHTLVGSVAGLAWGSSPRMRGTPDAATRAVS